MKKILSFLTTLPEEKLSGDVLRILAIESITIGIGFVIIVSSFADITVNQDSVTVGASLFALGVLLRIWRKEHKK